MITGTELRDRLGVSQRELSKWIKAGLPHEAVGRGRRFDPHEVAAWLLATGRAAPVGQAADPIALTRADAAEALGVSSRTIAEWLKDPSFPGRAGTPGRRDGFFPLASIETWRRENKEGDASAPRPADELAAVRAQKERLLFAQMQGQLIELAEVENFLSRQIATARTILDALPDQLVNLLPEETDDDTRAKVTKAIERRLAEAYRAIAETITGDRKPTPAKPAKKKTARKRTRRP